MIFSTSFAMFSRFISTYPFSDSFSGIISIALSSFARSVKNRWNSLWIVRYNASDKQRR